MKAMPALAFITAVSAVAAPAPVQADTRFLAYDASDRVTQALTRGLTLEVERGLFGAIRVNRLISTSARGEARIERGGPSQVLAALPSEAGERAIYAIQAQGDGRGLARALCPSAEEAWLVLGRVRAGRPLTMQAVGRWPDGQMRHCVQLSYTYRGEWALPPAGTGPSDTALPGFTR